MLLLPDKKDTQKKGTTNRNEQHDKTAVSAATTAHPQHRRRPLRNSRGSGASPGNLHNPRAWPAVVISHPGAHREQREHRGTTDHPPQQGRLTPSLLVAWGRQRNMRIMTQYLLLGGGIPYAAAAVVSQGHGPRCLFAHACFHVVCPCHTVVVCPRTPSLRVFCCCCAQQQLRQELLE